MRSTPCYGRNHRRLVISSVWPIILLAVVTVGLVAWELLKDRYWWHPVIIDDRGNRKAVRMQLTSWRRHPVDLVWMGLQRSLPLILALTFVLVPSTSNNIFEFFLCSPFEFAPGDTRRCA